MMLTMPNRWKFFRDLLRGFLSVQNVQSRKLFECDSLLLKLAHEFLNLRIKIINLNALNSFQS